MAFMKTTMDLPETLVMRIKLRAVHDGAKLKDTFADLLERGLENDSNGFATEVLADAAMMKRRREVLKKFVSGEWGVELAGYEEGRELDRQKAKERAEAWRD
jgi:hypothetical protein